MIDNEWVKRMGELKQMVEDLPDAPHTVDDVEYYLESPNFFGIDEFDSADKSYIRREMIRQYNVPD